MNDSFKDMIAEGWLIVYMDDMLITAANEQESVKRMKRVLQRMKELDLHLKLKKCKFGVKEVDFLGLISKGHLILFGIHQLLQKVHRRLLKHCPPTH